MVKFPTSRWPVQALLAAAVLASGLTLPAGRAQERAGPPGTGPQAPSPPANPERIRYVRNVPGDAQPLNFSADEIFTWMENNQHLVLLRGQVLVQQGIVQIRCQQAVGWLDPRGFKERGIWKLDLYCEDSQEVHIDDSTTLQKAPRALVEINTRGKLVLSASKKKLEQQNLSSDPLVQRARQERSLPPGVRPSPLPTPAAPVPLITPVMPRNLQGASPLPTQDPKGPRNSGLQRTNFQTVQPVPPAAPPAATPLPLPTAPAASGAPITPIPVFPPKTPVQPVQGVQTLPATPAPPGPATAPVPLPGGGPTIVPAPLSPGNAAGPLAPAPPPGGGPAPPSPSVPITPPPNLLPGPPGPSSRGPLPPPARPARPENNAAALSPHSYVVSPRRGEFNIGSQKLEGGETAIIVTGGVILTVKGAPNIGLVDIEADKLVIFTRRADPQQLINNFRQPQGESGQDFEFYLAGNVEIREQAGTDPKNPNAPKETRTLRAAEVYYDVNRNVAVALTATLELKLPPPKTFVMAQGNPMLAFEPIYVKADEILRTSATTYEVIKAEVFSTKLPSDPGLKIYFTKANIEEKTVPKFSLFGREVVNRKTGEQIQQKQTLVEGRDVFFELENIPFFYLPYLYADARDPLGPVQSIQGGYNRVYGAMAGVVLDVYDLLGMQGYDNTKWRANVDYLSRRGPDAGTQFDYAGNELFGMPALYTGTAKGYVIYDKGTDILGGFRPVNFTPDAFRGRVQWQNNVQDMPEGFVFQSQVAYVSDRNFLEQYFNNEWTSGINQQTFAYIKQQQNNWAWTGETEAHIRPWVNESIWLPKVDGYLIGQDLFDRFTYFTHASAGFAQLRITTDPVPPGLPPPQANPPFASEVVNPLTDRATNTSRLDWMQEIDYPVQLGPIKFVPYAMLDLTSYSEDINGNSIGRIWGGGGFRSSMSLSRLFPDIQSELFNVNGIFHKIVLSSNYLYAQTNVSHNQLPQLDRLNDDASDQSVRDVRTQYPFILPGVANVLTTSPIYDPQEYAIRRMVLNRIDTLDNIDVLQLDFNQRWQTKRGYPGAEHIIDWMTLDLSGSVFPQANRDNFGTALAFLEYYWTWNIGDRTTLESTGWLDPEPNGPRHFTLGAYLNRTDRTSFYLGYRQIDPLQSKAVFASVTYIFSPKYAMTASATYDFGISAALANSLMFTRVGTDLQVSFGITYNALQSNFGVQVEIVPNLVAMSRKSSSLASLTGQGGGLFGH